MSESDKPKTLDYTVDFPKLPDAPSATSTSSNVLPGIWSGSAQPAIKSSVITEAFKLGADERASRGIGKAFGTATEEQQKCNQIAQLTGTKIELNEAKDQSITILITGKQKNVEDARTRLVRELQTQATIKLEIPKEHHSFIIGKQGLKLRQLEQKYLCRIHMPNREEKSDVIRIVGPNEYIVEAAKHIKAISDEMAKQKTENLDIPRLYYQWIRGINNEKVDELMRRTGTKINIPPSYANNETIIITGERDNVDVAAAEIINIYKEKKETVISVEITVNKPQHRFIIGRRRQGLDDIFRETDVIVEMPSEESNSDTIILRGTKEKIADAAAAVYQRASSSIANEIPHEEWIQRTKIEFDMDPKYHRHFIVKGAEVLREIQSQYGNCQISFPKQETNQSTVAIKGQKEQIEMAKQRILEIVAGLETQTKIEFDVDPKYHRHFILKGAELLRKIQNQFGNCQISFPKQDTNQSTVAIKGHKDQIEMAKQRILEIVADLESKAKIQFDVDPKYHRHFIVKGAEVLREIQSQNGNCQISFPKQDTNQSTVAIKGHKDQIEMAKQRILEIVADLESKAKIEFDVDPKYHRHFILKGAELLRKIQNQFGNCQISFPKQDTNQSTVAIKGHKDQIEMAKQRILEIVADLESQIKIEFDVDPKYHRHFIVKGAEVLREIQSQYGNCQISFPEQETNQSTVAIKGQKEQIEMAKQRILEIVAGLESMSHISLKLDSRFYPRLIGARGRNLRKVEEDYGVEIEMPNRKNSSEPDLVTISGKDEQHVLDCADKLRGLEEDFIGQLIDRNQYLSHREEPEPPKPQPQNIEITGAPWQLDSMEQFPTIASSVTQPKPLTPAHAWGGQR